MIRERSECGVRMDGGCHTEDIDRSLGQSREVGWRETDLEDSQNFALI